MISEVGRLKLVGGAILAASAMTLAAVSPAFATSYEDLEDKAPATTVEPVKDTAPSTTVLTDDQINEIEKKESEAHEEELFNRSKALDVTFDAEVGSLCTLTVTNQHSVHSDTLVEVVSGDELYLLEDVESEKDKVTKSEVIKLGENTSVYVTPGPSGHTSLKASDVSCEAPKDAPVAKPIVKKPTYTG